MPRAEGCFAPQAEAPLETERRFEAWAVQVPVLPQVPQFRAWKVALRDEVTSFLGCPDAGFRWLPEVEQKSCDELQCSGSLPTLDATPAAALSNATTGELVRQINLKKAQAAMHVKFLKGGRILSLLCERYRVSEADGAISECQDWLGVGMNKALT